ncbi:unnamed protein product, partial [marine sediment metagenome]
MVRRLLDPVHMELKGKEGVDDLTAGHRASLLGFNLWKRGNKLEYRIGDKAWSQLREHLKEAHEDPDPP